jgi:hypothetical protein
MYEHDNGASTEPVRNRAPLVETPLLHLPLGAVRPEGWLFRQLHRQVEGLTGHAEEVFPELGPANAWRGGTGDDWEKGPYYLRGLIALAFVLDHPRLRTRAGGWVDAILSGQREDGQIGPASNFDWWPRMVITSSLRDYFEATGDGRVAPALLRYARYMAAAIPEHPLQDWARARVADQIDTWFWLYNLTGETFLLDLADKLKDQGNRWNAFFAELAVSEEDFHPLHGVNVSQAMKYPVVGYQRSGLEGDRALFGTAWRNLREAHGLAFGMWSGTERLAGRADHQGVELCSMAEQLLSNAIALKVLADPAVGDEQERIAYNLLAAATGTEFRQYQYYTLPNAPVAKRNRRGALPFADDHGDDLLLSPHSGFHCCCYNLHMAWPKFVQNTWMATGDGGLALVAHGPTSVSTRIAGVNVSITSNTDYPFGDTISLEITAGSPVRFPLLLRIPSWCKRPKVRIGEEILAAEPNTFARIDRVWRTGETVVCDFPSEVSTSFAASGAVSVWRGPLAFSLRIEERAVRVTADAGGFEELELLPVGAWNYALCLYGKNAPLRASLRHSTVAANPWNPVTAPLRLEVSARRAPEWTLAYEDNLAETPPESPVLDVGSEEIVTLVPMGCQTLRITAFPWTLPSGGLRKE